MDQHGRAGELRLKVGLAAVGRVVGEFDRDVPIDDQAEVDEDLRARPPRPEGVVPDVLGLVFADDLPDPSVLPVGETAIDPVPV
ncbi:MAG: hypothetical protein ABFC38_08065 [Methanospirillum sp.]